MLSVTYSMKLFVFMVLWSGIAVVTAMDGCQSDRDKDHRPRLNCTAVGLSHVPADLDPMTKVLLFPRNLISSLSWENFQIFNEVHEIDLTSNQIPQVTPGIRPLLQHLSVLRLGHNHLTSLVGVAFSACPALTELFLDNNGIQSLSDDTFMGLNKLKILDLSANHIRVLPPLLLYPLVALITLYLENNKISMLPDDWFSQKEWVPYLYLSANPWECFCTLTYLHTYLQDYSTNFYVRNSTHIEVNGKSLVCDSPQQFKGQAIIHLELFDLCSPLTPSQSTTPTTHIHPTATKGGHGARAGVRGDGPIFWHPMPTTQSASLPIHHPMTSRASVAHTSTEVTWIRWQDQDSGRHIRHITATGVFCLWLFAGSVMLCATAAVYTLNTLARLIVWYRGAYKSLRATLAMRRGAHPLRQYCSREGPESCTMAVYRSVLFVSRERGEAPQGQEGRWEEQGAARAVYRTTLHHAPGRHIEGAGLKERFSMILRQEREGPSGGREELDWVVAVWQVSPEDPACLGK
ncbi:leucine-rich repeat and transmembrane domain-containing protein 2 isoform X2 [Dunckerocampus dactyliophorus]|uniref:leucine-rich repeat and transmembrane domain-containing protein 2 isoform X2 n=1 Tax=Dunckerocampus dactyliophorus TaxID=161453 RepID=UPI002405A746|nr:leucine-rich repeat and transmembrane domain-containing protein 2 isoform X2 [Dunckerocampus dactyliophorus]